MTPVSMSNATYLVMSGKFLTEPQNVVGAPPPSLLLPRTFKSLYCFLFEACTL